MKYLYLSLCFSVCIIISFAQPTIEWAKCYGGSANEYLLAMTQAPDSGYVLAGYTLSSDGDVTGYHPGANCALGFCSDAWIVKTDKFGTILWNNSFGGSDNDIASQIILSGTYIYVLGNTFSIDGDITGNHGLNDAFIVKLDNNGNIIWQKSFGGTASDGFSSIKRTSDDHFAILGSSTSNDGDVSGNHGLVDYWFIKIDSLGNIVSQKCYGGSGEDYTRDIINISDGGNILTGFSRSHDGDVTVPLNGMYDYWILKIDSNGILQWQNNYGGSMDDNCYGAIGALNSEYLITGNSKSNDRDVTNRHDSAHSDAWTLKINNTGNIIWKNCYGGTEGEYFNDVISDSAGNFILCGSTNSNDGDVSGLHGGLSDYWLVEIDNFGNIEWQKCLGGPGSDEGMQVIKTMDGGIVVAGTAGANGFDVSGNHGGDDFWLVKLNSNTNEVHTLTESQLVKLYPMPVTEKLVVSGLDNPIKCSIFDISGKCVYIINAINSNFEIDFSSFKNGIYFFKADGMKGRTFIKN